MNKASPLLRSISATILLASSSLAFAQNDPATLARLRDSALASDYAWQRLADLTDLIGPRLHGSPGAAAAVAQVADAAKKIGLEVTLQPTKGPYFQRGEERGSLVDYAGRPQGITQKIVLTALGNSTATPPEGITAPVVVVRSMDELKARAAEVKGAIVLFDVPFDQGLADNGMAFAAIGRATRFRGGAQLGGTARAFAAEARGVAIGREGHAVIGQALVRAIGGANFRLPHTGGFSLAQALQLPAAAVTVEDSMLMARLAARGPLKMNLVLTPKVTQDAPGHNVIADLRGSDKADEVVIISGHLDSWDLGTGAIDDGAGVAAALGAVEAIKRAGLKPRRTIRVVAWANEENGGAGARAYEAAYKDQVGKHFAAIESDSGAGRPIGIFAGVTPAGVKALEGMTPALLPLGAATIVREDALRTGDLSGLERMGVPSFEPSVDRRSYFHYHHTPADTLDKVEPENLKKQAALMAVMVWYLANMEQPIGRAPLSQQKDAP